MCRQSITIALCAPTKPPALTFTCGKLHMLVDSTTICEKAAGECVCYVGTCGAIEKAPTPKGVDFSELDKVRCLQCTAREDQVGDRRDTRALVESRLLDKFPVPADCVPQFEAILRATWGTEQCPFHEPAPPIQTSAPTAPERLERDPIDPDEQLPIDPAFVRATLDHVNTEISDHVDDDSPTPKVELATLSAPHKTNMGDGVGEHMGSSLEVPRGLECSRWRPAEDKLVALPATPVQTPEKVDVADVILRTPPHLRAIRRSQAAA